MLKLITLICMLAALLSGILSQVWLRSRRGHDEVSARVYGTASKRNTNFRRYQYAPVCITAVVIGAAVGVGISWKLAAVYAVGAAASFACLMLGTGAVSSGLTSSVSTALNGDMLSSLRASYRTGSVMGTCITITGTLLIGLLFIVFDVETAIGAAACLGLGVSTSALYINTGGSVYSSAYSLAVEEDDFSDQTGLFAALGADLFESYMLSGIAVVMLAQVGVDTSGITSTFTLDEPARFAVMIFASGLASSIIGMMVYRGRAKGNPAGTVSLSCMVSGVLSIAAIAFFSKYYLQSYVYAWCAACGIAAGLILAEISKLFAYDSKIMIGTAKTDRRLGTHQTVIFNLSAGMLSVFADGVFIVAALVVSYMFSRLYGIAVCAAGLASITGTIASVNGFSVITGSAAEFISSDEDIEGMETVSEFIDTAAIRSAAPARTYASVSSVTSAFALFIALVYTAEVKSVDMLDFKVFSGTFGGAAAAFILFGLIILAVKITGIVALRNMGALDEDKGAINTLRGSVIPVIAAVAFPAVIGLFFGIEVLVGFLCAVVVTGSMIRIVIERSGQHFSNTGVQALGSLIKMMVIFSAAFIPAILKIGGFIFR